MVAVGCCRLFAVTFGCPRRRAVASLFVCCVRVLRKQGHAAVRAFAAKTDDGVTESPPLACRLACGVLERLASPATPGRRWRGARRGIAAAKSTGPSRSHSLNHVARRAVISDIPRNSYAWSLNHWQGTRVEIAAEFEPAAAHEAFPRLRDRELALQARARKLRSRDAVASLRTAVRALLATLLRDSLLAARGRPTLGG